MPARIRLDDSIEPWLPELANRRVLTSIGAAMSNTVLARRAITLRDPLTYRMGLGSVMAKPEHIRSRGVRAFDRGVAAAPGFAASDRTAGRTVDV